MAVLTQEMKDMIHNNQCYVGTVSKDGLPNVAPKRSTRVFNDETLIINEGTGGATYQNLLDGSKVVVAVANREIMDGYRFICRGELIHDGEIYEQAALISEKASMPRPKAVALLHIEEIHSLKPGPMAGKKIG
ncbi:MAG: pyridoxamine 5'-phosphate oxidase [Desulfitobacterium sp.]|nr:pyridoxamine 5'-phosphate oxidase [Desulfitobacterium sp.]